MTLRRLSGSDLMERGGYEAAGWLSTPRWLGGALGWVERRVHRLGEHADRDLSLDQVHPDAPPFRTLSSKYPVEDLAESLAEGIVSGHPDMPIFVFSPTDVQAIIDYLQSIQDQPAPDEDPAEE